MASQPDGYEIAREHARELAAAVAEYEAALQGCDAATSRLKAAEERLRQSRDQMLTWMGKNDVLSTGNYGWQRRFVSFIAAIARPDAAGTVAPQEAEAAS